MYSQIDLGGTVYDITNDSFIIYSFCNCTWIYEKHKCRNCFHGIGTGAWSDRRCGCQYNSVRFPWKTVCYVTWNNVFLLSASGKSYIGTDVKENGCYSWKVYLSDSCDYLSCFLCSFSSRTRSYFCSVCYDYFCSVISSTDGSITDSDGWNGNSRGSRRNSISNCTFRNYCNGAYRRDGIYRARYASVSWRDGIQCDLCSAFVSFL